MVQQVQVLVLKVRRSEFKSPTPNVKSDMATYTCNLSIEGRGGRHVEPKSSLVSQPSLNGKLLVQ